MEFNLVPGNLSANQSTTIFLRSDAVTTLRHASGYILYIRQTSGLTILGPAVCPFIDGTNKMKSAIILQQKTQKYFPKKTSEIIELETLLGFQQPNLREIFSNNLNRLDLNNIWDHSNLVVCGKTSDLQIEECLDARLYHWSPARILKQKFHTLPGKLPAKMQT